jgi:hypothetical protein
MSAAVITQLTKGHDKFMSQLGQLRRYFEIVRWRREVAGLEVEDRAGAIQVQHPAMGLCDRQGWHNADECRALKVTG